MFGLFTTSQPKAANTMQMQQPTANQMVIPSQAPSEESQQTQEQTKAPLRLRGGGNFIRDCLACCLCCCVVEDICCCELEALCGCCNYDD